LLLGKVRVRKDVEKGQDCYDDDIVDYQELIFEGIDVPEGYGVFVVFSKGWRKGIFYDFEPIGPQKKKRKYSLWVALGYCFSYVAYQEMYSFTDSEWKILFDNKWFPFIGFSKRTVNCLIGMLRSGYSPDEVLPLAVEDLKDRLPALKRSWSKSDLFQGHRTLLDKAVERFLESDWVSVNSILYPRIEGVLRGAARTVSMGGYGQKKLASAPLELIGKNEANVSRLLPTKFNEYLEEIYFKSFSPEEIPEVSRNSVGHGVADESDFTEKYAVIGFLIVEQVFYHSPPSSNKSDEKNES